MPVEVTVEFATRLEIGQGNIESTLETEEQVEAYCEAVKRVVRGGGDKVNAACCVDERCARCTMKDVQDGFDVSVKERRKPEVLHKTSGGLQLSATMAAVAADWSGLYVDGKAPESFEEAYNIVGKWLKANDYQDAKHIATDNVDSDEATGCGAADKAETSEINTFDPDRAELHHGVAAALRGGGLSPNEQRQIIESDTRLSELKESGFFGSWDPVKARRELENEAPEYVEVLEALEDETHGHHGDALIIIMDEDLLLDRDELYEATGGHGGLVYSRGFMNNRVARDMATSPEEHEALKLGLDRWLTGVGDTLFAKGMPVIIVNSK